MGLLFKNNAETTLSSGINDSVTTVPVTSAAVFPTPDANNVFFATIDDGTNIEVVKVTAISSNDLTVVRAQDNTSASAFSSGANIELRLTAKVLDMGTASLTDLDGDTKIQVEESSDEDKVRFDTGGTERMVLDSTGLQINTETIANLLIDNSSDVIRLKAKKNGTDDVALTFQTQASGGTLAERVRITGAGIVGIGTDTPSASTKLEINGDGELLRLDGTGGQARSMRFRGLTTGTPALITIDGSFHLHCEDSGTHMKFSTADTERMRIDSSGNVGIGTTDGDVRNDGVAARTYVGIIGSGNRGVLNIGTTASNGADGGKITFVNGTNAVAEIYSDTSSGSQTNGIMAFSTCNIQRLNIDAGGNINKYISNYSATSVTIADNSVNGVGGTNNTGGLLVMKRDTGNLRSISAAGSINASGNDYAEYMTKSDGCGNIAKGDVVGVDVNGKLTKIFNDAISFVIKSTDPSYVGGDTWLTENQSNPEHEDYINPKSEAYNTARASVDRIAFCGQVPVNITGTFNVGDYVYPQAKGTDIEAVAKSNPTFEEYQLCVGKIWAIQEDGRPFVSVKIN